MEQLNLVEVEHPELMFTSSYKIKPKSNNLSPTMSPKNKKACKHYDLQAFELFCIDTCGGNVSMFEPNTKRLMAHLKNIRDHLINYPKKMIRFRRGIEILFILLFYICIPTELIASWRDKIEDRFIELSSKYDTLIVYNKFCSGCITGTPVSTFFMYRRNKKKVIEYYQWNNTTGKLIYKTKTFSDKVYKKINEFVIVNRDSLLFYNGTDIYIDKQEKIRNDTATGGKHYSFSIDHGRVIKYYIKQKETVFESTLTGNNSIKYLLNEAPIIGNLLLILEEGVAVGSVP